MANDFVPLTMGDKVVGKIKIDLESGELEGLVDPTLAALMREGFHNGLLGVSFLANAGLSNVSETQAKFQNYLSNENGAN